MVTRARLTPQVDPVFVTGQDAHAVPENFSATRVHTVSRWNSPSIPDSTQSINYIYCLVDVVIA